MNGRHRVDAPYTAHRFPPPPHRRQEQRKAAWMSWTTKSSSEPTQSGLARVLNAVRVSARNRIALSPTHSRSPRETAPVSRVLRTCLETCAAAFSRKRPGHARWPPGRLLSWARLALQVEVLTPRRHHPGARQAYCCAQQSQDIVLAAIAGQQRDALPLLGSNT